MSNNTNGENDFLTSRLREVFDVCDVEKRGFISVDHFVELAKDFANNNGQSDKKFIDRMVSVLDSEGNGRISFEDFCRGVREILRSNHMHQSNNNMNNTVINDFLVRRQSVEDPTKNLTLEVYETTEEHDFEISNHDDCFQDDDTHHPVGNGLVKSPVCNLEEDADSGSWSATPQEINWPPKDPSHIHSSTPNSKSNLSTKFNNNLSSNTNNTNSNNNNNIDDCDDEEDEERGSSYFIRKCPSTPLSSTPRSSIRSTPRVSAPTSRSGSFRKSVTPSAVASQLYRSNMSNNCSDYLPDSNEFQVVELTEKITKLEDQLITLSETQKKSQDKHLKHKEESAHLIERVHLLEEQLRDMEVMNEERFKEEQKKHKDVLMKTERDKTSQIEILTQSLKLIESEYSQLKCEAPSLKSENEQLKRQNFGLERELAGLRQECSELHEEKINIQQTLQVEQAKITRERNTHSQLLDELTQELNELRQYKSEYMKQSPAHRKNSDLSRSLRTELEMQITQLKQDNSNLKYQLEEQQAIILNKHIEEGQALVRDQLETLNTLAVELDEVPKNELMNALQREQESNRKLREYIEQMTLRILESNPNILEINSKKNNDKKKK